MLCNVIIHTLFLFRIAVVGRTVEPIVLQDIPGWSCTCKCACMSSSTMDLFILIEHERLKEEVIAADGIVEEYFAFDSR